MRAREYSQTIADSEANRWSAKPIGELISELKEAREYRLEVNSKQYQIEVELLENTEAYIHGLVAVDHGSLPQSLRPVCASFIVRKT